MSYNNFIELGKEIFINQGPLSGTFGVIVDIISVAKVLIQQLNDVAKKCEVSLNKLIILNQKIDNNKNNKEKTDLKNKNIRVSSKDSKRSKRNNLNDFERYKVKHLKKSKKLSNKYN